MTRCWRETGSNHQFRGDGAAGTGAVPRFLGYPVVIFSGDEDIDGTTENFPRHEAAMTQGPNRFALAQFYIACGLTETAKLGMASGSRIIYEPSGFRDCRT